MNKRNIFFLLLGVVIMVFTACKKTDDESETSLGYNYFPMKVGDSLIYDVHIYNKDLNTDDSSYQLLERVESTFEDNEGRSTFRLERYVRTDENSPWSIYKVWTANLTPTSAEKKEDNITYVKLVFPAKKNLTWNGNIKNIYANDNFDDYKITGIDEQQTVGTLTFDSTLTVTQSDYDYGFESSYHVERYALGVGLVYKEIVDSLQSGAQAKSKIFLYTEKIIYSNK